MTCRSLNKCICHQLKSFYVSEHFNRYVHTLMDKDYRESLNLTKNQVNIIIRELTDARISLHAYDEIVDGKRQKKQCKVLDKFFF